jgi:aminopeptidase N
MFVGSSKSSFTHDDILQQSNDDGNSVDVQDVMDTWILQQNYPVVKVTFTSTQIRVEQSRYVLGNSTDGNPSEFK